MSSLCLNGAGPFSRLGGDIQIQLALAMNANGNEADCIALFKYLEQTHPIRSIRKQAKHLCFIMEAPKLAVPDDEKIQVPQLNHLDANRCW